MFRSLDHDCINEVVDISKKTFDDFSHCQGKYHVAEELALVSSLQPEGIPSSDQSEIILS